MAMYIAAVLCGGVLATLTDCFFLGFLSRKSRNTYPEVWWPAIRDRETKAAKIWTALLGFLATASVVLLYAIAGNHGITSGAEIGLVAFIIPAAFLLTAFQFVKMDLWLMTATGLAWLARLIVSGIIVGLLVP